MNSKKIFILLKEKKKLLSNFIYLVILRGFNYIFPLIILSYLVKVLSTENFGLIVFAQTFIQYFIIFTDYGFNFSAVKEISIYRNDLKNLSEIFSSIIIIKIIFLFFSVIILTLIVFVFSKFREYWFIYYLTFGTVIGHLLFPIWFFQGIEEMKYITYLNGLSKFILMIVIFIVIHKSSDYIYVPIINSVISIINGIIAMKIIFNNYKIKFRLVKIDLLIVQIKKGWSVFIGNLFNSIINSSVPLLLGIFGNNSVVGYFSVVDKLIKAISGIVYPVAQTIFPYISYKYAHEKNFLENIKKHFIFSIYVCIVFVILTLIFYLFAGNIIIIFFGKNYFPSILLFKIMLISVPIHMFIHLFLTQTLININAHKLYQFSYIFSVIIGFTFFFLCKIRINLLILGGLTKIIFEVFLLVLMSVGLILIIKKYKKV